MGRLTAKQQYDERKRLRLENELRGEQRRAAGFDREDEMEARMTALLSSFERIASVLELWADLQPDAGRLALSNSEERQP